MFMDAAKQDKLERMEKCVEEIRRRFGKNSIDVYKRQRLYFLFWGMCRWKSFVPSLRKNIMWRQK